MKKFLAVFIPVMIWLLTVLMFIFIPRLIIKRYFPWYITLIFGFFLALIYFIIFYVLYDYFGLFNLGIFNRTAANRFLETKVTSVDPVNIRKYLIDYFMRNPSNPVNLMVMDFALAGIRSVGSGEKTEIYVDKFRDSAYGKFVMYYVGVRVNNLTKIYYETRKYHPEPNEEELLLRKICNNLAKSPEKIIEIEQKIIKTPFGDEVVKIERKPIESAFYKQQEEQKEEF